MAQFTDELSEHDATRFTVIQGDLPPIATSEISIATTHPVISEAPDPSAATVATQRVPTTVDDALRLAIKLAVDGGDYDGASTLIDVAKRMVPKRATVIPIDTARDRK